MKSKHGFALSLLLTASASACSAPRGKGAQAGGDASQADASKPPTDAAEQDVSQPPTDAPANGNASAACAKYCTCMAANCAAKVFANGCVNECGAQTNWDLPCRTNMCTLVPAQPNNDHCTHAFGAIQCLNK